MKITFPNGVTVEIDGVEEITAAMPSLAALANQAVLPETTAPEKVTVRRPAPVALPEPEQAAPASRVATLGRGRCVGGDSRDALG